MNYIVQKFGGTSLGTAERMRSVAAIVQKSIKDNRVILVLSAMSSYVKSEGTTSRLIAAADAAQERKNYAPILQSIQQHHLETVSALITGPTRDEISNRIQAYIDELKSFLHAISVIGELSTRSQDVIIGTGERLSACIFAGLLNSMGIAATYCDLSTIIEEEFREADQQFYAYVQSRLRDIITSCGSRVPVLTGYFGFVPNGIIASIGRGYTDFTAALAAAAMQARELQIWKEVDGVFTADPRKVNNAQVLPSITPEEAAELTYYGSEVIHPFTMEQVMKANIPIRIKNTFKPELPGTIINPRATDMATVKPVTAVTAKRNITVLNINSNRMLMAYGFLARVFTILARHSIIIDLIATSEVNVSMTLDNTDRLGRAIPELEELGNVTITKDMAIISLVGRGQKHCVGLAGKMFSVLAEAGINIEMISQGASEINISCVIKDEEADKAMRAIHKAFLE